MLSDGLVKDRVWSDSALNLFAMDNFFIATEESSSRKISPLISFINRGLRLLKTGYQIDPSPDPVSDMSTIEQRINYFHLLDAVISNQIPGDVVELGCFTGQCAMLFQKVIQMNECDKKLHLYDSFETKFNVKGSIEDVLINNFQRARLVVPILHKGYFESTIPRELPDTIAFVHIDCGSGRDKLEHKKTVIHCLESVYPRMKKGAVCILMDYHDKSVDKTGHDVNPGVKLGCDEFLSNKPETVISLYGNQYSHGFFKKN
jgi:O-methyltransferase